MSAEIISFEYMKAIKDYKNFVLYMRTIRAVGISDNFIDTSLFPKTVLGAVGLIAEIEAAKGYYIVTDTLPNKWIIP